MIKIEHITLITEAFTDQSVTIKSPELRQVITNYFKILKALKPVAKDTYVYYIKTDRGRPEDWLSYEEWADIIAGPEIEEWGSDAKQEYREDWKMYNPDEVRCYKIEASIQKNGDYLICINDVDAFHMLRSDEETARMMSVEDRNREIISNRDYIAWLVDGLTTALEGLTYGWYMDYIRDNFSYRDRSGKIQRGTLWELCTDLKERELCVYENLSEDDIVYIKPIDTPYAKRSKYAPADVEGKNITFFEEYRIGAAKEHIDWDPIPEIELAE